MNKYGVINFLGGSVTEAAKTLGITPQAVTQWPDELPNRIVDRVVAFLATKDPEKWPAVWKKLQEAAHA